MSTVNVISPQVTKDEVVEKDLLEKREINPDTILPKVELFVNQRQELYLLLNTKGNTWCVTTKLGVLFTALCDGYTCIRDIYDRIKPYLPRFKIADAVKLAIQLDEAGIFQVLDRPSIDSLSNIEANITKKCNLSCPFCYADSGPNVDIPEEKMLRLVDWVNIAKKAISINPNTRFIISGGEPLLHPEAMEIISNLCNMGIKKVVLVTNGTLLTNERIRTLTKLPNLRVQLSIDSLIPEENAKTRGKHHLAKALKALNLMKDGGIDVVTSATVTQINQASIWRLCHYCSEIGVKFRTSVFFIVGKRSKKYQASLGLSPKGMWEIAELNADYLTPVELANSFDVHVRPGLRQYTCGIGYGTVAIDYDGTVYPCNHLTTPEFALGNTRRDSLIDIVKRGKSKYSFIDVDYPQNNECNVCPVRYQCTGGCRGNSYHHFGTLEVPPPECEWLRQAAIESLWINVMGTDYCSLRRKN